MEGQETFPPAADATRSLPLGASYPVQGQIFQGPLHLLVHLAERQDVDLRRIHVGQLVDEYLAVLRSQTELPLTEVGAFLALAGRLVRLKAEWDPQRLLPTSEDGQALLADLRQLQAIHALAERLAGRLRPLTTRPPWRPKPPLSERSRRRPEELVEAYRRLRRRVGPRPARLPTRLRHPPLAQLSAALEERLRKEGRFVLSLEELWPGERGATFLAALFLAQAGRAALQQEAPFAAVTLTYRRPGGP